jgi:hypothetical protein
MIGVGVLGWQLVEAKQELTNLKAITSDHSDEISSVQADTSNLKSSTSTLETDTATLKSGVLTLETDASTLKSDVSTLETDTSTLKSDVSTLEAGTLSMETDVSALQTATAIPASKSYGPYVVYCGTSWGSRTFHIDTPMSRVTFDFSATGSSVVWFVADNHVNPILDKASVVVWADGGSFVATEAGDYQFVFACSSTTTPSTVSVSYTIHAPAPVVAGS